MKKVIAGKTIKGKFVPSKTFKSDLNKLKKSISKDIISAKKQNTLGGKKKILKKVKKKLLKFESKFNLK